MGGVIIPTDSDILLVLNTAGASTKLLTEPHRWITHSIAEFAQRHDLESYITGEPPAERIERKSG